MRDLAVALGLALALEGALYALLPDLMKKLAAQAMATPRDTLRIAGAVCVACGVAIVWIIRG